MLNYYEQLNKICEEEQLNEVRKEEDLYLMGPFWIIGKSLADINKGNFDFLPEKFLIDWEGNYQNKVSKSEFTHKGIWETKYQANYKVAYNYYPRGRVSFNSKTKEFGINIPKGLNEELILPIIMKEYGINESKVNVKYTDITSGDHYSFLLD